MPFTDSAKNEMLDAQSARYLALYVGDPSGAGTECVGTGYARQLIEFNAAALGARDNTNAEVFDTGANSWSSGVSHWATFDAPTGGTRKSYGPLSATRDMSVAGAKITFAAGDIDESI